MADAAREELLALEHTVLAHDLYAEGFNPVQPGSEALNTSSDDRLVEAHCSDLARADLILIFHPNWWSQPPAILKGWIDRVVRLGTAWEHAT